MRELSRLELISPHSIAFGGVGHIRCPTANQVIELADANENGETVYNGMLNLLIMTKAQFLESMGAVLDEEQLKELDAVPLFDLLVLFPHVREMLGETLSFFIEEEVIFISGQRRFVVIDPKLQKETGTTGEVGSINAENFVSLKSTILRRNSVQPPKNPDGKRRSKRMVEFDKKLEAGRKQSKKYQEEQRAMQLGNLVAKIACYSNTPISAVMDYTVYQIYDLFAEYNAKIQIDSVVSRWSTWGKDSFDFSLWYKTMSDR